MGCYNIKCQLSVTINGILEEQSGYEKFALNVGHQKTKRMPNMVVLTHFLACRSFTFIFWPSRTHRHADFNRLALYCDIL